MKIAITTFGCDSGKSGIGRYAVNLLRELDALDGPEAFEVLLHESEEEIFVPAGATRLCPRAISRQPQKPLVNLLWHQRSLPRLCRQNHYDALFIPAGNRRLPFSAPCPTVGTVHDLANLHVSGKYDRAHMFYLERILPRLIRRLTKVITVSESSKRDIVEYIGVPEERIVVIPEAPDHRHYFPRDPREAGEQVARRYSIRPPYVLFISRLEHPGKNHVRLIQAFTRLKEAEKLPHQLVLAGGDWLRADEIHRAAAASPHAADIVFTGFFPEHDLPALYGGAELFVFPSLYEGFGIPILEAMACGTAVTCSNTSSLPEVAGDAGLLFDPHSEEAIAEAMARLLLDDSLRRQYIHKGLERSRQFDWSVTAHRTLEVLRAVVS